MKQNMAEKVMSPMSTDGTNLYIDTLIDIDFSKKLFFSASMGSWFKS